jgi:hypothetical protein
MVGVRGFSDPNVQMNAGNRSVWYQYITFSRCLLHLPLLIVIQRRELKLVNGD